MAQKHFTWQELEDLTPGLYTRNPESMPDTAAQIMHGCYPEPDGGLRPHWHLDEFTLAGVGQNETIFGLYARGGIPHRTENTNADDMYLFTFRNSDGAPKLYRFDNTANATSWQLLRTWPAPSVLPNVGVRWATYTTDPIGPSALTNVYFVLDYGDADDRGLWRINYNDGTLTQIRDDVTGNGFIVHQDRLVATRLDSAGSTLVYTTPRTETFDFDTRFLDVEPSADMPRIQWVDVQGPDVLVVARQGSSFYVVQGDIDDPILREMADVYHPPFVQTPVRLPGGVAYQSGASGIVITDMGNNPTPVSDQISATQIMANSPTVSIGEMAFTDPFLWTPRGFIMDRRTMAWSTHPQINPGNAIAMHYDRQPETGPKLYIARSDQRKLFVTDVRQGAQGTRGLSAYAWRSAPWKHPTGREIRLREVQVYLTAKTQPSVVSVIANGITRSHVVEETGRQMLTFRFDTSVQVLDIVLAVNNFDASREAPSIDRIRVGTLDGHLTDKYSIRFADLLPPFTVPIPPAHEEDSAQFINLNISNEPPPLPGGMLFHLNAGDLSLSDNDPVTDWDGGNGFEFESAGEDPVYIADAVNNEPAVDFVEDSAIMQDDIEVPDTHTHGAVLAVVAIPDGEDGGTVLSLQNGIESVNVLFAETSAFGGGREVHVVAVSDGVRTDENFDTDTYFLIEVHADGSSWSVLVNGSAQSLTTIAGSNVGWWASDIDGAPLQVVSSLAFPNPGNLHVAELMVFSGDSSIDVSAERAALMSKYDL